MVYANVDYLITRKRKINEVNDHLTLHTHDQSIKKYKKLYQSLTKKGNYFRHGDRDMRMYNDVKSIKVERLQACRYNRLSVESVIILKRIVHAKSTNHNLLILL